MENGTVVRKFKLWFVWQDEKHEQWLQRMAAQGLHLRDTNCIGLHTFVRGAPADVAYRWDVGRQRRDPEYMQLFQDAGWEYVASTMGWHCWRKTRKAGAVMEIFTDNAGRIRKYRTVLRLLALAMVAQVPSIWINFRNSRELLARKADIAAFPAATAWLNVAVLLLLLYAIARIGGRVRNLKRA
ncbi:DUF2812 domain-containing protein [Duganella sp. BJB480]|uniref:DUF2812 domain-containing protein n=1 Tax=unclassified Duganella TaxID=2636909 RepID=UPI000ECC7C06|nr:MULTISPECIES: DUF2812 domain-containing protein [unclassified Duganella]NVD71487.1 DUF2812 domain-containing protein [Duganella sp. BJB1802]RFP34321.1 DUF2812 domain-containing protein [Duganella sp. BJB480]